MPDPAAQGHRAGGLTADAGRASEPTLPELLSSAWRRGGRWARAALVLLALAAVALVLWLAFGRGGDSFAYEGDEAPPFSISWGSDLDRTELSGRGPAATLLALEGTDGERLTIRPFEFDPAESDGELLPQLALLAGREPEALNDRVVLEGRTKLAVDRGPEAYQIAFTAPASRGAIEIGKLLLVPDPDRPGEGVEIKITERTDDPRVIEKVSEAPAGFFLNWPIQLLLESEASVRTSEGLEEPLRSFEFG